MLYKCCQNVVNSIVNCFGHKLIFLTFTSFCSLGKYKNTLISLTNLEFMCGVIGYKPIRCENYQPNSQPFVFEATDPIWHCRLFIGKMKEL